MKATGAVVGTGLFPGIGTLAGGFLGFIGGNRIAKGIHNKTKKNISKLEKFDDGDSSDEEK